MRTVIKGVHFMIKDIIIVFISGAFTLIATRITSPIYKRKQVQEIRKKQFDFFFAPMHRLLFFKRFKQKNLTVEEKFKRIDTLIYNNYKFIPEDVLLEYQKCIEQNEITTAFKDIINSHYEKLKEHLGFYYSPVIKLIISIIYILTFIVTILIIISSVYSIGTYINPKWPFLEFIPINAINITLTIIIILYILITIIASIIDKQLNK